MNSQILEGKPSHAECVKAEMDGVHSMLPMAGASSNHYGKRDTPWYVFPVPKAVFLGCS